MTDLISNHTSKVTLTRLIEPKPCMWMTRECARQEAFWLAEMGTDGHGYYCDTCLGTGLRLMMNLEYVAIEQARAS